MIKFSRMGIVFGPLKDQLGCFARFNPGVILLGDTIHMLYRATDCNINDTSNYVSSIGYAKRDLNTNLIYDSNKQVIFPTLPQEIRGCEDPRIVEFEGEIYVFYTAFDGKKARVAIAKTIDFETFEKIGVINIFCWDKDAFIFPERINGKIAYMHRVAPNIQIDYFDSIEQLLSKEAWKNYRDRVKQSTIMKRKYFWETSKIGGSMPPIKTDKGWLLVYHAVDENLIYRASVALLDLENPSKVIARIPYPMIEPSEDYELNGDVNNVVFPEGGFILDGELIIYYGAADKYIAKAKIEVAELMAELEKFRE